MVLENPAQPVCDQVAATLRAGNHVWLVGDIPLSQTPPPQIQPAPNNPWGWLDDPYSDVWGAQVGYFVAMHATRGEVIPIPSPNPISPLENVAGDGVAWLAGILAVPNCFQGNFAQNDVRRYSGGNQKHSRNTNEGILIFLLCFAAALRVFIFSAAFPFFSNVDEYLHFDLITQYSRGHVPRSFDRLKEEALDWIVPYASPEFLSRA